MLNPSAATSLPQDLSTLLSARLRPFRSEEAVLAVANKMLQKSPTTLDSFKNDVELAKAKQASAAQSQRAWVARRALARRIGQAIAGTLEAEESEPVLPRKLENYLSFLDLAAVSMGADAEANVAARTWWTFSLAEHDWKTLSSIAVDKLRRRLKRFLPEDRLASVQMDIDVRDHSERESEDQYGRVRRIFFRVANVAKTKKGNDEKALLKKAATFVAYYPGEAYFYCDKRQPELAILDVIISRQCWLC